MVKRYSVEDLFKSDCPKISLLRVVQKGVGFSIYLPYSISKALGLSGNDHALVAFVDDSSSYTTLVIFKDSDLSNLLKTEILSRRQRAEQIQKQLRAHLQAEQQTTKVEQEAVSIDI